MLKSSGSVKMILKGSVSFNGIEFVTKKPFLSPYVIRSYGHGSRQFSVKSPSPGTISMPPPNTRDQRNQAAVKVQKTYKSFRTRRQLADCAVLVEQRWWKLVDSVEPKLNAISFFDIDRPETAVSRWSRAMTKAAMVGKGLSKAGQARKLALQHWLEAIDPRHRYGHNLQFYYAKWLQCDSRQAFFYWLDIGEGREVNLERCQRSKLQQQCIKYLGPVEREAYQVKVVDGNFLYKHSGKLVDTRECTDDTKWIFVLSVSRVLYVGQKRKGTFQHSSFLAGGATLAAGRLVVENGILKAVWPHSGHYLPTEENFEEFICFLEQHNVDITLVKRAPSVDEEGSFIKKEYSFSLRSSMSEPDLKTGKEEESSSITYSKVENVRAPCRSRRSSRLRPNIPVLEIPKREDILEMFRDEEKGQAGTSSPVVETPAGGYETAEEYLSDTEFSVSKHNLFDGETEEDYEEPVPKEKIARRIVSHQGMKSYQLADQLSCRWTTGAGPRIGCVRDYPVELQFRVLEEVNLSPKSTFSSPRKSARTTPKHHLSCREANASKSPMGRESMLLLNQVAATP
ncbi:PREDICTED: IQ domain-containing protein IQM6-like isoform X2 [Ipomoea nil]|nr:PREDICTED: IQ domain-containing protein IQM6-like isoform X2 [Ipomoea nil]